MRPRLLDLFCGAGGAAMGYHRAGFEVVGVDIKPQKRYPFEFVQGDALEYVAEHGREFDVIHASPPCERYSRTNAAYRKFHPDLIEPTRQALRSAEKPYVIENVEDARRLLINPLMLCGSMFGLPIERHRYFEYTPNFVRACWSDRLYCRHIKEPVLITGTHRRKGQRRVDPRLAVRKEACGIAWMTMRELDQSIPPAYTEYIGRQLINLFGPSARWNAAH